MANHSFSATFTGSAADVVAKARAAIENAGGTANGDDGAGGFSVPTPLGTVTGLYTVSGQSFSVEITDKPFLLPESAIEAKVRGFLV
jgi:hypothetical protein